MKQVVIIDEAPLFREYLQSKLTENSIETTVAVNCTDGIVKLRNIVPDLVIIDHDLSREGCWEVLKQKRMSPNLAPIPVIVLARLFDQDDVIELAAYNAKKVFKKPVMIDTLLAAITDLLKVYIEIDKSPGIIEVHVNDDIIFVEITEGLNSDKFDILSYKIQELLDLYKIREPKLIIMISGISMSVVDTPNITKLFRNVLISSMARHENVRVLTKEKFVLDFLSSHDDYCDIEIVDNLRSALDGLTDLEGAYGEGSEVLMKDIVLAGKDTSGESMLLRFERENKVGLDDLKENLKGLRIAVVDDEEVIRKLVRKTFSAFEIEIRDYKDGMEFISVMGIEHFDLIFLDILMPKADGFAVLREMNEKKITTPVIIFSVVNQRDTVIRAFQMGIKSYIAKPIDSVGILKKTLEILRVNF